MSNEQMETEKLEENLNKGYRKKRFEVREQTKDFIAIERLGMGYYVSEYLELLQYMKKLGFVFRGVIQDELYFERLNQRSKK